MAYHRLKSTGMSERETLLRYDIQPVSDTSNMLICSAAEHPDYPVRNDIIRMDVFDFTLMTEEGGDLKMEKF